jgi:hypothetical protein
MATQHGAKGNPAGKRMVNAKRKERRQKSWARGEKRKAERRAANDARAKANEAALAELGGTREMYERVTIRDGKTITRMKRESPGSALYRVRRGYGRNE